MQENKNIYFIGIGGIGMSALAQLFLHRGHNVSGSDRSASPVTELLEKKGIQVYIGHDAKHVPEDADLIVYSDAIPTDSPERVRGRELGKKEQSYFQALGEATKEYKNIVVSGTNGKTTTTAMIAKILTDAGVSPTVIVGSLIGEYGSNFKAGESDIAVIEGCEYKRHFLHLNPYIFVITNIELEHTDYFKDEADVVNAFKEMIAKVPKEGSIVAHASDRLVSQALEGASVPIKEYGDMSVPELLVPGEFNIANAQAAKTAAQVLGISEEKIDASLSQFKGTWRRFEIKGHTKAGALVVDDYAHHPSAIHVTLEAARKKFLDKKIVVVFHPHLYSRTKSFFDEFAHELAKADEVLLLPIYAAREKLDPEVTSEKLVEKIQALGTQATFVADFEVAKKVLESRDEKEVIFTMGAGDVYKLADLLTG
jgi:UDP-N-acetylmuramate--alanine ligase